MSQNVLSRESSRRGAAERQRRWRARQRVRRQTEDRLRQRLGRAPTEAELRDEVEAQLAGLGLALRPGRRRWSGCRRAGAADASTDTVLPDGGDGEDDRNDVNDFGDDLSSAGALRDLRLLAERRPSAADRSRPTAPTAGRGVALASVSFELRIAAERDRIFDLLMQRAEEGDASALLFLASRLAPPARPRRVVSRPRAAGLRPRRATGRNAGSRSCSGSWRPASWRWTTASCSSRARAAAGRGGAGGRAEAYRGRERALAARQGGLAERVAASGPGWRPRRRTGRRCSRRRPRRWRKQMMTGVGDGELRRAMGALEDASVVVFGGSGSCTRTAASTGGRRRCAGADTPWSGCRARRGIASWSRRAGGVLANWRRQARCSCAAVHPGARPRGPAAVGGVPARGRDRARAGRHAGLPAEGGDLGPVTRVGVRAASPLRQDRKVGRLHDGRAMAHGVPGRGGRYATTARPGAAAVAGIGREAPRSALRHGYGSRSPRRL